MSDQITRLRVVRTLVIEGPTAWVLETLTRSWIAPEGEPNLAEDKRYYEADRLYTEPFSSPETGRFPGRSLTDTELQGIVADLRARRTRYQQTHHNPAEA